MPSYTTADIRNIALLGHAGTGKTSLAEALLKESGAIGQIGLVEKGTTTSDYTEEEKEHGHSLIASAVHMDYDGRHINIIDTPGYPDFLGQALSALPAVETAMIIINAQTGIEPNTRRMMAMAKQRNLCRMIVINKIDAENINLPALLEQIQETFGSECIPINLPGGGGTNVVDVFDHASGEVDFGNVADAHTAIVDQVVEVDEKLMEQYLEKGEVSPDELHAPFEKALREGHLVPVCFASARHHNDPEKSVGIADLLQIITKLAPNPLEGNPRPFEIGDGDEAKPFTPEPDPAKPAIAHTFTVQVDPFVGRLSIFRIHQGTVTKDSQLIVGDARKPFKVGHLFKLQGKDHKECTDGIPGDICAVAKHDDINFNSVLHEADDAGHLHLKPIQFPEPMFGKAITARSRADESKIGDALHKLDAEDPSFKWQRDPVTHQTVIYGLGELHLRIVLEKLKNRYKVEVDTAPPKIAYRETILSKAEGHHRHKKQSGGAGQFGEVYLRIEPLERDAGFEFENDIFGGAIPNQFIPAIEKGIRQTLVEGAIAGYPIQDVKVSVYDGKHHAVDSKEVAFITAGKKAFVDAFNKAKPVLLEPIVNVEVIVPNANVGDITGDMAGKRGRIQGTDMMPGDMSSITAQVPLSEMTSYQSQLKSVTGGQGSYTMELSHYEPVPANIQQQIVSEYKPRDDEE